MSAREAAMFNRNDLSAPAAAVICAGGTFKTWGDFEFAHRWALSLQSRLESEGKRVIAVWLNPGPDYRLGPIIFPKVTE